MPQPTTQTKTPSTPSITKSEKLKYFISLPNPPHHPQQQRTKKKINNTSATSSSCIEQIVVETTNDEKQKNQKDQRHSNKHAGSARL